MYAVIKTGGKQHKVSEGDVLAVEKVAGSAGDTVVFDDVLMVSKDSDVRIGTPVVAGAKVVAEIIAQMKAPKITVFKMKRRKSYHKKTGHRQPLTQMKVKEITF